MRSQSARTTVGMLCLSALLAATAGISLYGEQQPAQIQRDVERSLQRERDLRAIEVSVEVNEVTLSGRVPTFWAKTQAIEKTLEVEGVDTVVSELEIPTVEDDQELAQDVSRSIMGYRWYTMWDFVQGSVVDGVVRLTGSVTPDRDKAAELFERIAKIEGVQDIQTTFHVQSSSKRDEDLRVAIGYRVFGHEMFATYAQYPRPPFHILVDNQVVRLVGVVRSEVEKRVLEQIVRQTFYVREVINELQTG